MKMNNLKYKSKTYYIGPYCNNFHPFWVCRSEVRLAVDIFASHLLRKLGMKERKALASHNINSLIYERNKYKTIIINSFLIKSKPRYAFMSY